VYAVFVNNFIVSEYEELLAELWIIIVPPKPAHNIKTMSEKINIF